METLTTPPTVGETYLVPTVRYPWGGTSYTRGRLDTWPVMGPKHDDAEYLNFEPPHYHLDLRFLSDRQVALVCAPGRRDGRSACG